MKLTASRLAKSKKPLSDINQLRQAVKKLQKDANEQLSLEVESQATFNFLNSQVKALKTAFNTLTDVLMAEVDGVRKDTVRRCQELEGEVSRQKEMLKSSQNEVSQLKRTLDVWTLKERDWAKDNEILKTSHSHNIEWMQQLQRDVMETKDRVHSIQQEHGVKVKEMVEESCNLRQHWEKQVDILNQKLRDYDLGSEKQMIEIRAQATQRLDDLELMEKALGTAQKQQMQLRTSVDEALHAIQTENGYLSNRTDKAEAKLNTFGVQADQARKKLIQLERDQRQRYENITKVMAVFADALNIAPPQAGP